MAKPVFYTIQVPLEVDEEVLKALTAVTRPNIPVIRVNWAKEFAPNLVPAKKSKAPAKSLYEQIMEL